MLKKGLLFTTLISLCLFCYGCNSASKKATKETVKETTEETELEELDIFEDYEITTSSYDPYTTITGESTSLNEFIQDNVEYTLTKDGSETDFDSAPLEAGDTVIVTATFDEDLAEEEGYEINTTSKEYTVHSNGYYITDNYDLNTDSRDAFLNNYKEGDYSSYNDDFSAYSTLNTTVHDDYPTNETAETFSMSDPEIDSINCLIPNSFEDDVLDKTAETKTYVFVTFKVSCSDNIYGDSFFYTTYKYTNCYYDLNSDSFDLNLSSGENVYLGDSNVDAWSYINDNYGDDYIID